MNTSSPPTQEEQQRLLDEALGVVKVQAHLMRKCLDGHKLMDGLKHCSTMLAELRTSALTPKNYYELYMAIFDALRHLTTYLIDAHESGRHKLSELYELVQYAGNIVPRLYLMITVGSVFMGVEGAPVKELMRDMMEMSRGVQHPTRGLFLRHYLSGMTRDKMPVGDSQGPEGNLKDSIKFIIINFTEMNKLWVRLQHQGHSRDRERREMERKELRILVGTNLVRLSQLDGVGLDIYQESILPAVLDQVVKCRDMIAQEYLMEVIIQVFQDDFHLRTLHPFLETCKKVNPRVSVKNIIIGLIDRLAAFAAREAEEHANDDEDEDEESEKEIEDDEETAVDSGGEEGAEKASRRTAKAVRGIPQDVPLFEIFWEEIHEIIKARPDINIQDITAMLVSLTNLTLSCYPDKLEHVDRVLAYARERMEDFRESPDLLHQDTIKNLLALLCAPIQAYPSVMTLLALSNYAPLLAKQHYSSRRAVAHSIVNSMLKHETYIETTEDVNGILEMCSVLVRDQKDLPSRNGFASRQDEDDFFEEQSWMARLVHLFQSESADEQFMLLSAVRKQFSDGGDRIRFTFPSIVTQSLKLAQRYKALEDTDEDWSKKCSTLFRFMHQVITVLYNKVECHDLALRLFLIAGQSADQCGFEEIAYDYFVQAFTIYEEAISESRAQFQALSMIVGALQSTRVFGPDNYDTLSRKCTLHAGKLLKRPDQCRAVCMCTHLYWHTPIAARGEDETTELYRDEKRLIEVLHRAIKIADSCLDAVVNVQLFVEILNRYIYYFERHSTEVTVKYVNGLIDLINTNLGNMDGTDVAGGGATALRGSATSALTEVSGEQLLPHVLRYFKSTLLYLERRRDEADVDDATRYSEIETVITVHA